MIARFRNATGGGQSLPQDVREEIFAIANNAYGKARTEAMTAREQVVNLAKAAGIDEQYLTSINAPEARDVEQIFNSPDVSVQENIPENLPPVPENLLTRAADYSDALNIWADYWPTLNAQQQADYVLRGVLPE